MNTPAPKLSASWPESPSYILFAQHGWADTHTQISQLARSLTPGQAAMVAPNLGFVKTWWRIEPLVAQVEKIAAKHCEEAPDLPKRIVGHSMGGLIWLEVLNRNPQWWPQIQSLTLVASPVGGADLGRIFDPMGWGIGIARDLGTNRRFLAERIAQHIPTQIIASDMDGGSDGTVTLQCTQFRHAQYVKLSGIHHSRLKAHPEVAAAIVDFWANPTRPATATDPTCDDVVDQLRAIPGMTDAHYRDFGKAQVWATLKDGLTLRVRKNLLGIHHVFLADRDDTCQFAGFVGWLDTAAMYEVLNGIRTDFGP
ncbi:MAG: lysophospholipase [Cyanobacteria bacterium P01_A01_bin.114]